MRAIGRVDQENVSFEGRDLSGSSSRRKQLVESEGFSTEQGPGVGMNPRIQAQGICLEQWKELLFLSNRGGEWVQRKQHLWRGVGAG